MTISPSVTLDKVLWWGRSAADEYTRRNLYIRNLRIITLLHINRQEEHYSAA